MEHTLPPEILSIVFKFLPCDEVFTAVRNTCQAWRDSIHLVKFNAVDLVSYIYEIDDSKSELFDVAMLNIINCQNRNQYLSNTTFRKHINGIVYHCCENKSVIEYKS